MYNYKGMKKLTIEEAKQAFKDNKKGTVYKLYDDNTEAAIEDIKEFENENFFDYDYGIELENVIIKTDKGYVLGKTPGVITRATYATNIDWATTFKREDVERICKELKIKKYETIVL